MISLKMLSERTGICKQTLSARVSQRGIKGKVSIVRNTRLFTKEQAAIISVKRITLYRVIKKQKKPYFEFSNTEQYHECFRT